MQVSSCDCDPENDSKSYCVSVNHTYVIAYNNNGIEPVPARESEVYGAALVLELNFDKNIAVCYKKKSNPYVKEAFAMSCRPFDYYKIADSITHITISADKAYDADHPAGTELNEYFKMPDIEEFNNAYDHTSKMMYAIKGPDESGTYVYTMKVLLADGTFIEASTEPVNILK